MFVVLPTTGRIVEFVQATVHICVVVVQGSTSGLNAPHMVQTGCLRVETHGRIERGVCDPRYYHSIPNDDCSNQCNQAEVLLNRIEIQDLHRNFEVADGYISRFLAIFKPFIHMSDRHPRHLHIQLQKVKRFLELFELEYGATITCQRRFDFEFEIKDDLWQLLLDFNNVLYARCNVCHVRVYLNWLFCVKRVVFAQHLCLLSLCGGSDIAARIVWTVTGRH